MVYVDPGEIRWLPFVKTWLQNFPSKMKEETKAYLLSLFSNYIDPGFKYIRKNCVQGIDQVTTNYVHTYMVLQPILSFSPHPSPHRWKLPKWLLCAHF